jgi:hypothetical protein
MRFTTIDMDPINTAHAGRILGHLNPHDIHYPLHTAFTFPSEEVMDLALASPERAESLARTRVLLEKFDGRVFHIVTRPLGCAGRVLGA